MAQAIINSINNTHEITCYDISAERLDYISKHNAVTVETDLKKAVSAAQIIVLSVKPQVIAEVLTQLKPVLPSNDILVVSIAAGITTGYIEKFIDARVVRAMPNTPISVGMGATALCKGSKAANEDINLAKAIFNSGIVEIVEEKDMNAVTALSGSGPAYVFYLCELMTSAAVKLGLNETTAAALAKQTIYGAGKMLANPTDTPEGLRKKVTSPNGTTEAAIKSLENSKLGATIEDALSKAAKRAKELEQ